MNSNSEYRCPSCRGDLAPDSGRYVCRACKRTYPIEFGIPDFRLFHADGMDHADDMRKAEALLSRSADLGFEDLLRFYWTMSEGISEERAEKFTSRAMALVAKGKANLREIDVLTGESTAPDSPLQGKGRVLEIGCGTGGFLVAAHTRFERVSGMDIGYQWLILARKRLEEAGCRSDLVCACAEHLPYGDDSFDLVVAEDVIEHVREQDRTLEESHRVLKEGCVLFMATPNRFSLSPEPHVGLWGVGWLPRSLMGRYVRMFRDVSYDDIRIVSRRELRGLLRESGFEDIRIETPRIPDEELKSFSSLKKLLVGVYDLARSTPLVRRLLYLIGPFFHVVAFAGRGSVDP